MGPLLGSCWKFVFFWFFWCLCRSSGLFFLVFLVPANVLYMSPQDHDEKIAFY
jgi:hypothetical protein